VFWGHGYAIDDFDPRIEQADTSKSADATGGAMGRVKRRIAHGFPGKRGQELKLLFDSTHDGVLNNRDFASVLSGFNTNSRCGGKIQVLGLDCCNMAMAEVLSELQDYAEYAVAAETGLPFESWLSAEALNKFLLNPRLSARELSIHAVDEFVGSFPRSTNAYIGLSACNLAKCKHLEVEVKNLVAALWTAIDEPQNRANIYKAWFKDVSFLLDGVIDLSSFCFFLETYMKGNQPVCDAAKEVQKAVTEVVIHSKVSPDVPGRRISLSKGMSIWFPPWIQVPSVNFDQIQQSRDYFFHGYPQTRFAQATGWNNFLRKLLVLTQGQ
jgi:hypothetical protein